MIPIPLTVPFDENGEPSKQWLDWADAISRQPQYWGSYTTANRPINKLNDGDWILDTTLGYVIWYYSGGWIDATGGSV